MSGAIATVLRDFNDLLVGTSVAPRNGPQEVSKHVVDTGILLVPGSVGIAIAAHGAQKAFGWFGGYGLKRTGGFFEGLEFGPGVAFAASAGLSELGGGTLLTLGLFTPLGAAAVLAAMIVAMASVHVKNGFFAMGNGIELPFLYAAQLSLAPLRRFECAVR